MKLEYWIIGGFVLLVLGMIRLMKISKKEAPIITYKFNNRESSLTPVEKKIFNKVNAYRISRNLKPLKCDMYCSEMADYRTSKMIFDNHLRHAGLGYVRKQIQQRGTVLVNENIAKGHGTVKGVVKAWIESEEHHRTMIGDWDYTGVSAQMDGSNRVWYCQIFIKQITRWRKLS